MRTCWTHGEYYGGTCPHCAAETNAESVADAVREAGYAQAAAVAEAARRHAKEEAETRRVVVESAARHEKAVAEDWKLRAEAKGARAAQLFQAGMWQDTVKVATEAIAHDDRGNIKLHMYAAWGLVALGSEAEARQHFEAQIRLLRMPEYASQPVLFSQIFERLPNDTDLMVAFDGVVDVSSSYWDSDSKLQLIRKYISHGRAVVAKQLFTEANPESMKIRASSIVLLADLLEFDVMRGPDGPATFRLGGA